MTGILIVATALLRADAHVATFISTHRGIRYGTFRTYIHLLQMPHVVPKIGGSPGLAGLCVANPWPRMYVYPVPAEPGYLASSQATKPEMDGRGPPFLLGTKYLDPANVCRQVIP